ncbi:MAG: hypothetical protein R3C68_06375 [Myxococcota bacterium]
MIVPGEAPIELLVSGVLNSPLADGTLVSNQASVLLGGASQGLSDDPDTVASGDPTNFQVSAQATLSFIKSVQDLSPQTPPLPGDRLR